jgi:hypothetical protein
MDDNGHKSGHLMLITPERVFYAGLLGRPRQRCSGAFNIYVSIEGGLWLTTADGRQSYGEMVAVLPNVRHTIASRLSWCSHGDRAGVFARLCSRTAPASRGA